MALTEKENRRATDQPQSIPASEVKQRGWRGVMRTVREHGALLVTNHSEPEAVIMGIDRYEALLGASRQAEVLEQAALDALRRRFDERLEVLRTEDAGDRLRATIRKPAKLGGKVRAGTSY